MDPVLDRVRAANPVSQSEYAGLANFEALPLAPRRRRRWVAVPAAGAVLAALVVLPTSAPQATEVLLRATEAVNVDDGILYARSTYTSNGHSGSREIWVLGDTAMRWKGDNGAEEVYARGQGTTRRGPDGEIVRDPGSRMVPTEIFRVRALLERARDAGVEETDEAYVLRWNDPPGRRTLWVDKQTYVPLRLTDESSQTTFTERIVDFKRLPDTPRNRALLELG